MDGECHFYYFLIKTHLVVGYTLELPQDGSSVSIKKFELYHFWIL